MISTDLVVSIIKHNAEQQAIPLEKVKQARNEIENKHNEMLNKYGWSNLLIALKILDKLIESEDKE